jgi:hypothetical protein
VSVSGSEDLPGLRAVNQGEGLWDVDGRTIRVPDGQPVIAFVLARVFEQAEGSGPWSVSVLSATGLTRRLMLNADGTVSKVEDTHLEGVSGPASLEKALKNRRRGPVLGRRALLVTGGLLSLAAVGTVAGFSINAATSSTAPSAQAPTPTSAPTAGPKVLWRLPDGITGMKAAGPIAVGVVNGHLAVFNSATGTRMTGANNLVVADPAQVRVFSGGGVSVVDAGNGAGAFVINGKATQYQGKGALLARGPVPVLVAGAGTTRKYFAVRNGALVGVKVPQSGNSLFGGLPGGGTIWAVAGAKVTYVPATGTHRTITLASPLKGAKVTSWVAVSETRTALIWTKGKDSVLAVHATGPGAQGAVELKQPLNAGQTAWADGAQVVIGPGKAGVKASGALVAVISLQGQKAVVTPVPEGAALVGGQLWTPSTAGAWAAGGFTSSSQPVAAGDGFALVAEGEKFVAVPGPSTTTK